MHLSVSKNGLFLILLFSLGLFWVSPEDGFAQDAEATSDVASISVQPDDPTAPAELSVEASYRDSSDNQTLDVLEEATIDLTVSNSGEGKTSNVEVWIYPEQGAEQLEIQSSSVGRENVPEDYPATAVRAVQFEEIQPGETKEASVSVLGARTLTGTPVKLAVDLRDEYGFAPQWPTSLAVQTNEGGAPDLTMANVQVEAQDGQLKPNGDTTAVTFEVENLGTGIAQSVSAEVKVGEGGTLVSGNSSIDVGTLSPHTSERFSLAFAVEGETDALPVQLHLNEERERFSATAQRQLPVAQPSQPPIVDREIPTTDMDNSEAIAVVMGIRNYQSPGVPNVEYAKRDAKIMREYLVNTLGFKRENILPRNPDQMLTLGRMKTLIQNKLPDYVRDSSDVFVFYSGHGAPDTESNAGYLVPADADPNYVSNANAYSLDQFYQDLASLENIGSLTVVMDACFSGRAGGGQNLIRQASNLTLSIENPLLKQDQATAFLASEKDQLANWYPQMKHGMFTYFFLKGLRGEADLDGNQTVTVKEMEQYLTDDQNGVPYWSRREFSRPQNPQVQTRDPDDVLVRYGNDSGDEEGNTSQTDR